MKYRNSKLSNLLLKRILFIFIISVGLFILFYKFVFPYYYFWKMEQPVEQVQKKIEANKSVNNSDNNVIVISTTNFNKISNSNLNEELEFKLNKSGISLNKFWLDKTSLNRLQHKSSIQRLYGQDKQKNQFYAVFFIKGNKLYLVGTSIVNYQDGVGTLMPVIFFITIFILALVLILIVLVLNKEIVKPIKKMEQTTKSITALNFTSEDVLADNELGNLSESINEMKNSLKYYEQNLLDQNNKLKEFSSNLSHELKTPISVMQLLIDAQKQGLGDEDFLPDLEEQISEMNTLVHQVLIYSRESKQDMKLEPIQMRQVLNERINKMKSLTDDFTINCDVVDISMLTNVYLFNLIIDNLISNSMKYSLDKKMSIKGKLLNDKYYDLEFCNKSSIMSEKIVDSLKDPFVVGEKSRNINLSGTGLGLSIVDQAVQNLNGKLKISELGENFIVLIRLPI